MKKIIVIIFLFCLLTLFLFVKSCVISNPQPEESTVITTTITRIEESTSYDIAFYNKEGDMYYINRGLELRLNLEDLNASVLNKTVTLHLPKLMFRVSNHISQLAIGDTIIFTEFD